MKQIFILLNIVIILGCDSKSRDNSSSEDKAVIIIKTKAYTTKPNFDKLTFDRPMYNLGYDEIISMDFSWSVKYFDKYNNMIKLEKFNLDSNGSEKIYTTKVYQYYSPEKNQLSYVKIKNDWGNEEEKYIRDSNGQLKEIIKNSSDTMNEKTVYTYNSTRQKIKKETYKQNGLVESFEYVYDSPQKDNSHVIKEIRYYSNYRVETEYKWLNDKITSGRRKYFEDEKLVSDMTTYYKNYVGNVPTEEIAEGIDNSLKQVSEDGSVLRTIEGTPFRRKVVKTLDDHKNILTYSTLIEDIDENGQTIAPSSFDLGLGTHRQRIYECKYTYNQKNHWTELLFSADNQKYLVVREITYLD